VAGEPTSAAVLARLWTLAAERLPEAGIEAYTQGMMDLGASVCTQRNPLCGDCPVALDCIARAEDRVADLPGKRTRRAAPRRRIAMLVLLSGGEVLLEKRAPSGIWGGLWSLPEVDAQADIPGELSRRWGIRDASVAALPSFEHAFTHFTLEVSPWRVSLARHAHLAAERGTTWLSLADIPGAALPSPVKALLRDPLLRAGAAGAGSGAGPRGAARRR
jgi:A/G-specific adenine glycosylase